MFTIELLISIALCSVLFILLVVLSVIVLKSRKQISQLQHDIHIADKKVTELKATLLKSLSNATSPLKIEIKETRSGFISLQKQLQEIEEKLLQVENQQANVQVVDGDSKLYRRAVKMVELGADIEEIIAECEIPRAEAELLMSLHRAEK